MAVAVAPAHIPTSPAEAPPDGSARLVYLDNLKIVLVIGVIAAHAATYYIGGGAWLNRGGEARATLITLLGVIGLAGGLFWIGLFFLIAGLLAPKSLARHGPKQFLKDRLIRLGLPFLVYLLLVIPLLRYAIYALTYTGSHGPDALWEWASRREWPVDAGPLWFVADLLVFSTAYVVWRQLRGQPRRSPGPLRPRYLVALAVGIASASFALRLMWPLFTRQYLDMHLSQWPQYILLFWFGTVCAERGWLTALPDHLWRRCGWALGAAAVAIPILGMAGGALSGQTDLITGGWHWQALCTAVIEGVLAVAGSLWMLELFRRRFSRQGPRARVLSRASYGAYVVHEPLLVAFALAVQLLALPIDASFLLLAPAAIAASFALTWLIVIRLRLATGIL